MPCCRNCLYPEGRPERPSSRDCPRLEIYRLRARHGLNSIGLVLFLRFNATSRRISGRPDRQPSGTGHACGRMVGRNAFKCICNRFQFTAHFMGFDGCSSGRRLSVCGQGFGTDFPGDGTGQGHRLSGQWNDGRRGDCTFAHGHDSGAIDAAG